LLSEGMKRPINNFLLRTLPKSPVDIRDTRLKGFILRLRRSGTHSYLVEYGRGKIFTLGTIFELKPAEARSIAEQVRGEVRKGIDPMEAKRLKRAEQQTDTWSKFLENEYGPWVQVNRKTGKATWMRLRQFHEFDSKKLNDIIPWLIEKWRSQRLKAGKAPSTVNRDLTALKAALSKAVEWKFLPTHPLKEIKLQKVDDPHRIRYLNDDEARRLKDALDARQERQRREREDGNLWRRARSCQI
jgi:integrase